MLNWIIKFVGAIFTASFGQGFLLWLGTKGIYPAKWVAAMIGYAESVNAHEAIWWMIVGSSGLIGLLIASPIFELGKRFLRKGNIEIKPISSETEKPNPFIALAQEFKECDSTWKKLTRPPEMFVMDWMRYLDKLRIERNTHDIPNLFNLIPMGVQASPGSGHMNVSRDEILFTLRCLELRGYLVLKKTSNNLIGGNGGHYNEEIKYTDKYDDFMKGITFKDTTEGYNAHW